MKLTKSMQKAGIVRIIARCTNGAWLCDVELEKVDRVSKTNYRSLNEKRARTLTGPSFKLSCVRNPWLRFWRGKLQSIDGRHTSCVLMIMEHKTVTAEVRFHCNDQDAADIFYQLAQNSQKMEIWSAYNAAVTAHYPWAMDMERLLAKHELTIPAYVGYWRSNADIRSFDPLMEAWKIHPEFLNHLLTVVASWRAGEDHRVPHQAGKCFFLRGLIDFLSDHGNVSLTTIVDYLSRETPDHYARQATRYHYSGDRPDRKEYKRAFEAQFTACCHRKAA